MATVALLTHPRFLAHDTGAGHPERPDRLRALLRRLEESGLTAETVAEDVAPATVDDVRSVHDRAVVERVRRLSAAGHGVLDGGDTVVSADSWDAALLAAGAALTAVRRVIAGDWDRAFVACRPPGHHAERDASMGFCLFNNVAIAAEQALRLGTERVAVVDFDVHHGNGTQHVFEERLDVFYASLHQWPWYPGTGAASERGRGDGEGATLNVPMAAGAGDDAYLAAFDDEVVPALEAFAPELVLVSAGFDAHVRDPLSATRVTERGFGAMTERLCGLAGGRVVSLLEGGYDLTGLADSVERHVAALLG